MLPALDLTLKVEFPYRLHFANRAFSGNDKTLSEILHGDKLSAKALVLIDAGIMNAIPGLMEEIRDWFQSSCPQINLEGIHFLPGGEISKSSSTPLKQALQLIVKANIDRHSYLIAIGGGAFLDMAGFAATLAHRGVRLVRMPTTTLAQADSGVGVKNGINFAGQKNYLGTFAVPWATVNDSYFLHLQPPAIAKEGLSEAVKVSIVKDSDFFRMIEENIDLLAVLSPSILEETVQRSAILHARHIQESGDPFEQGTSRPLDFGHWSAHYLESMSGYTLSHGEAVSIGICLDLLYSVKKGWFPKSQFERVVRVLRRIGMPVSHPLMLSKSEGKSDYQLIRGLETFREHLGGKLTILMIKEIGVSFDVHEIDFSLMSEAISEICSE